MDQTDAYRNNIARTRADLTAQLNGQMTATIGNFAIVEENGGVRRLVPVVSGGLAKFVLGKINELGMPPAYQVESGDVPPVLPELATGM